MHIAIKYMIQAKSQMFTGSKDQNKINVQQGLFIEAFYRSHGKEGEFCIVFKSVLKILKDKDYYTL